MKVDRKEKSWRSHKNVAAVEGPIIVIDDDDDDHEIFLEAARTLDISKKLRVFHNAKDAFHFLKLTKETPFIVLCDIRMPGMDGFELRSLINRSAVLKKKSIPFIFFSTSDTQHDIKMAYDLAAQGYFVKSTTFKELTETLKSIIDYWSRSRRPRYDRL
jgi:DNA-binding NarL/FixJ family response regulator